MEIEVLRDFGLLLLLAMFFGLMLAMILFLIVIRKVRHLDIPPNAGFAETMLYTPFVLVLFIDLLDFALDILAAPFTWVILDRLGFRALRNIFAFEALLPFTGLIPTMTIAWFAVRLFGPRMDVVLPKTKSY